MTTKTFKMATSAIVGAIAVLGVLFYMSTRTTWGLASDEAPIFIFACGVTGCMGFILSICTQKVWEKISPDGYKNFTKKITSSFNKFSDEMTRED